MHDYAPKRYLHDLHLEALAVQGNDLHLFLDQGISTTMKLQEKEPISTSFVIKTCGVWPVFKPITYRQITVRYVPQSQ